jgi:putative glutamine amidotransferase
MSPRPLIGVSCCTSLIHTRTSHWASEKYLVAVSDAADAMPVLIPACADRVELTGLVSRLDGLLLTGSRSNIEPRRYGGPLDPEGEPPEDDQRDLKRDATTLPLVRAAIAADLPVLAICRGMQELNVALGGTLHRRVHEMAGRIDHRSRHVPVETRYDYAAHPVRLAAGGMLAGLAGVETALVNSLHGQGIDRLAADLVIEAVAPDGQIEAVRHRDADFVLGVQWHPEHRAAENPFFRAIFAAWGEACRRYAAGRPMRRSNAISDARSAASRPAAI